MPILLLLLLATAAPRDFTPYLMSDRAAEIALARSSAARDISGAASVLVLTRKGFVEAEKGSNGFTCVVLRSFQGSIGVPDFWKPTTRAPNCFNPPAAQTVLPPLLKRAEWVLAGVSTDEIAARTKAAYASHEFALPAPGAMAYMMSPHQHLLDDAPHHWMPHLMFYYDRTVTAAAMGAGAEEAAIIAGTAPDSDSPVFVLLIPVRRWSDGQPAL